MNQCEACKKLALMPIRSDVPPHLQKYLARALSFGFVRVTTYECVECETLWRWRVAEGWERTDFPALPLTAPAVPQVLSERYA